MEYIAHRINKKSELVNLYKKYGVEIDLRDNQDGSIFISHDPFSSGEDFEEYLKEYNHGTMILNIKSERIEHKVIELMRKYSIKDYFFLDSSFPMVYLLSKVGETKIALRYSEYEGMDTIKNMSDKIKWVWVDSFKVFSLTAENYDLIKQMNLKLCLVSPELQGRNGDIEIFAQIINRNNFKFDAICTKEYNIEEWQRLLKRDDKNETKKNIV